MPAPRVKTFADELAQALARTKVPVVRVLSPQPLPNGFWPGEYIPTGEQVQVYPTMTGVLTAEKYAAIEVAVLPDGTRVFAADNGGSQTAQHIPTNVCATQDVIGTDTVLTSLTVEKTWMTVRAVLDTVPTCEDNPNKCCLNCGHCGDAIITQYHFTIAGATNGSCTDCSVVNGTFTVVWDGISCLWQSTVIVGDSCFNHVDWEFGYNGITNKWELWIFSIGTSESAVVYRIADADFICSGTNVLTKEVDDGSCTGWPSTVTVIPG